MFKKFISLMTAVLLMCAVPVMEQNAAAEEAELFQEAVNLGIIDSDM